MIKYAVTNQEYFEFLDYIDKIRETAPEYRIGQAFLNYFPDAANMLRDYDVEEEFKLFYQPNDRMAWAVIYDILDRPMPGAVDED
jgi:hypothetical protein